MVSNSNITEHDLTYYDFFCDESDITAFEPEPLILDQHNTNTADQAVNKVLHHGMGIIPNLINKDDASELRDFVLWRNSKLTNDEKIEVLSWRHRYSFGIAANEHPPVHSAHTPIHFYKPASSIHLGATAGSQSGSCGAFYNHVRNWGGSTTLAFRHKCGNLCFEIWSLLCKYLHRKTQMQKWVPQRFVLDLIGVPPLPRVWTTPFPETWSRFVRPNLSHKIQTKQHNINQRQQSFQEHVF